MFKVENITNDSHKGNYSGKQEDQVPRTFSNGMTHETRPRGDWFQHMYATVLPN